MPRVRAYCFVPRKPASSIRARNAGGPGKWSDRIGQVDGRPPGFPKSRRATTGEECGSGKGSKNPTPADGSAAQFISRTNTLPPGTRTRRISRRAPGGGPACSGCRRRPPRRRSSRPGRGAPWRRPGGGGSGRSRPRAGDLLLGPAPSISADEVDPL